MLKTLLTNFNKFIVFQSIPHGIIKIQQAKSLAPSNVKLDFFHWGKSPVVGFVFHVPSHSFLSQPRNGVCGAHAWHCQPLSSDVHRVPRHAFSPETAPWPRRAAACSSLTFTMWWWPEELCLSRAQCCNQIEANPTLNILTFVNKRDQCVWLTLSNQTKPREHTLFTEMAHLPSYCHRNFIPKITSGIQKSKTRSWSLCTRNG